MSEPAIRDEDAREFRRIARAMDRLLKRVSAYNPEVNFYLSNDTWNLMKGPSHGGEAMTTKPNYDNAVESVLVPRSGGGDW